MLADILGLCGRLLSAVAVLRCCACDRSSLEESHREARRGKEWEKRVICSAEVPHERLKCHMQSSSASHTVPEPKSGAWITSQSVGPSRRQFCGPGLGLSLQPSGAPGSGRAERGGPGAVRGRSAGGREALGRRRAAAGPGAEAVREEEALPAMEELGWLAARLSAAWLALVLALIVLPSALGVSLGISEAYMWVLVKTLEVGGWAVLCSRRPFLRSVRGEGAPGRAPCSGWKDSRAACRPRSRGCPRSGARVGHAARWGAKSARHHFVAWEWGWWGGREEMAAGGGAAPPW